MNLLKESLGLLKLVNLILLVVQNHRKDFVDQSLNIHQQLILTDVKHVQLLGKNVKQFTNSLMLQLQNMDQLMVTQT